MIQEHKTTNIIIISDRQKTEKYIYSIISRIQPKVYNLPEHKCVKIWVKDVLLEYAMEIVNMLKHAGLIVVSKKRKEMNVGTYTLPNAWEIVLEKIPITQMLGEDEEEE